MARTFENKFPKYLRYRAILYIAYKGLLDFMMKKEIIAHRRSIFEITLVMISICFQFKFKRNQW